MDKIITLAKYINANEAHIAKGLLESLGIKAWVFDENASAYGPLIGEVRLAVRLSNLKEAREILDLEG